MSHVHGRVEIGKHSHIYSRRRCFLEIDQDRSKIRVPLRTSPHDITHMLGGVVECETKDEVAKRDLLLLQKSPFPRESAWCGTIVLGQSPSAKPAAYWGCIGRSGEKPVCRKAAKKTGRTAQIFWSGEWRGERERNRGGKTRGRETGVVYGFRGGFTGFAGSDDTREGGTVAFGLAWAFFFFFS